MTMFEISEKFDYFLNDNFIPLDELESSTILTEIEKSRIVLTKLCSESRRKVFSVLSRDVLAKTPWKKVNKEGKEDGLKKYLL
uniref:Uncharacterized protein n=1 Tax=Strongyloides venezuelensis TaxID=75913 RepID=A0A0K0F065_STRVS